MFEKLSYCWHRKIPRHIRWLTIIFGLVLTFYIVENIRGSVALRQYMAACEAQGEWFEEPQETETETNLIHIPSAKSALQDGGLFDHQSGAFDIYSTQEKFGYKVCRSIPFHLLFTDGTEKNPEQGARRYLAMIADKQANLDAFVQAVSDANRISMPIRDDGFEHLNILNSIKATLTGLRYRASARLAIGESEKALDDAIAMIRASKLLLDGNFMIDQLVGTASASISINTVWEGLAKQAWSEQQLKLLADELEVDRPFEEIPFKVFQHDRALDLRNARQVDTLWKRIQQPRNMEFPEGWVKFPALTEPKAKEKFIGFLVHTINISYPNGWYKLWFIKRQEQTRSELFSTSAKPESPFYSRIWGKYPSNMDCFNNMIDTTCLFHLAATAVANERFYLANGQYPNQLSDLVPKYLPNPPIDPSTRKELNYITAGVRSKRPTIYSLGENLTDNGGYHLRKREKSDVVWQYQWPDGFTIENYMNSKVP